MTEKKSILERWDVSEEQLTYLVDENPSLRGILLGYVAESKFHDAYLDHPEVETKEKDDDHNRKKKGDRRIKYKGKTITIEVKSLQSAMVKDLGGDRWTGKAQVDGSDRRIVRFPDGSELNTTLLLRGEFDLLAVNCFAFGERWRFVFAKNADLPFSTYRRYTEAQRNQLIASLIPIQWPPEAPFTDNPYPLLDELVREKPETEVVEVGERMVVQEEDVVEVKKT